MKRLYTPFQHFKGMMFTSREKAEPLLFIFPESTTMKIHTWFVKFPIVVAFYNSKGKLIQLKYLKPWRIFIPRKKYKKMLEIPIINDKEDKNGR